MTRDDETLSSHRTRTNLRPEPSPAPASAAVVDQQEVAPVSAA